MKTAPICPKCSQNMKHDPAYDMQGTSSYFCDTCKTAETIDNKTGKPWVRKNWTKRGA